MNDIAGSATQESFVLLSQDPFFDVVVDLVAGYLASAFDDPADHEVSGWTLTCLPSAGRTADHQRLFTLAIGPMEVLHVERYTEDGETVDYRTVLTTSTSALTQQTGSSPDALSMRYPLLKFHESDNVATDGDAVVIDWFLSDEGADEQFFALPLDETTIGPLAEHLAAQGSGPYEEYHNRWFAQHILEVIAEG
ncbi:hypothetical protein [Rhodococcus sp. NPDC060084]|uniref:hypothetical protein n=1 Tax=Rhodococcus sp. NPDC060084 TaxID=3347053 RepID=UPI0036497997